MEHNIDTPHSADLTSDHLRCIAWPTAKTTYISSLECLVRHLGTSAHVPEVSIGESGLVWIGPVGITPSLILLPGLDGHVNNPTGKSS